MSSFAFFGVVRRASAEPSFPAGKVEVSTDELVSIIRADLVERQYLVNGNVSSNVYLDDCYFTDARDDFGPGLKKWQRGTSLLFVANKSFAELTGDVVFDPKTRTIEITKWRQQDYFRLPGTPHSPVFTGSVTLTLHPTFNLIARHDEKWDMDPDTITKQITF
ncbi:SnoaL-like domain-containing protein [Pseudoscourfieldia marina]